MQRHNTFPLSLAAGAFPSVNEVRHPFASCEDMSFSNAFHFWEEVFLFLGNRHLEILKGSESESLLEGCVGVMKPIRYRGKKAGNSLGAY